MKNVLLLVLACVSLTLTARAQSADESDIRAAITAQSDAWNKKNIPNFMQAYEDSPDTTFIGKTLREGFQPIRQQYEMAYTNPAQMGKLTFTDISVRLLKGSCGKAEFAVVTGKFHLDRTTKGEATMDDGIFSLVWRKGAKGWKIVLDHTS